MLFGRKKRRIGRLLVVEDEPLIAFDNERFLQDEGYEVIATVDTVADAMARLDDQPDLILVDVNLRDGNGIEVARAAHGRNIAVMFVTGDCPDGAAAVGTACLSKPYSQRNLAQAITAIEAVLDGKLPRRLPAGFRLFGDVAA